MKRSKYLFRAAFACALLIGAPDVRAEEGHDHGKHDHKKDHAPQPEKHSSAMSSHDGMSALYAHLQEIAASLDSGRVEGVHGHAEAIRSSVKDLDKDTSLTAAKKTRVRGYVKNVIKLADKVHHAADGKKVEQAKKDFSKLQAQVDLLDKQFAHSHKPAPADKPRTGDAHAH